MRQVCFSVFVLLAGQLLQLCVLPKGDGAFVSSRRFSVPLLLYAAAELCCYGRGAAVLLPIRMLELLYGVCLYMGMFSLARLLRRVRLRAIAEAAVFPVTVLESALLGYVLLRDGYCRRASAASLGAVGMAAAVLILLLTAHRENCTRHSARSAR